MKKKEAIKQSCILDCEMDRISATLKETNTAQIVYEREKLTFERKTFAKEK